MDLNLFQKEAVLFSGKALRIIAGPGSGKTRVVVAKIIHLISELGVSPNKILGLTFTNKAADEVKRRVIEFTNDEAGQGVNLFTFHSLCYRILKISGYKIGIMPSFSIMDESEQKSIVKTVVDNLEIVDSVSPSDIVELISFFKSNGISTSNFLKTVLENKSLLHKVRANERIMYILTKMTTKIQRSLELFSKILSNYEEIKTLSKKLDFDDLIFSACQLFELSPESRHEWAQKFEYILVDEFQDVSLLQYRIVKFLSYKSNNITMVGDADQAIYSWRGADPQVIVEKVKEDFNDIYTIKLEQNYRSTPDILKLANKLIKHNKMRIEKTVFTANKSSLDTSSFFYPNVFVEAGEVAEKIKLLLEAGNKPKNICIIYRSNHYINFFENFLLRKKIPYKIINKTAFYNRRIVRDFIDYLKVLLLEDKASFWNILNVPPRGIGLKTTMHLKTFFSHLGENFLNSFIMHFSDVKEKLLSFCVSKLTINVLEELSKIFLKYKTLLNKKNISTIFKDFLIEIGYLKLSKSNEQTQDIKNLLMMLVMVIKKWEDDFPQSSKSEFLDYFALHTSLQEEFFENKNYVTCITAHAAKGLEFDYVFVVGLSESLFPITYNKNEYDIEEERRLAYVAITRAKKQLFLSCIATLPHSNVLAKPSRFLKEMGVKIQSKAQSWLKYFRVFYHE